MSDTIIDTTQAAFPQPAAFDAGTAFAQLLMLSFGGMLALLGGGILLYALYWLATALRVPAIIIGVRQKGEILYPVYRYQMPDGRMFETVSDTGSSRAEGKETGRPALLYVDARQPEEARRSLAGFFVLGFLLAAPGLWLSVTALTTYQWTYLTTVAIGVLAFWTGRRVWKLCKTVDGQNGLDRFRAAMRAARLKRLDNAAQQTVEQYTATPDAQKQMAQIRYAQQSVAPAILMTGFLCILYGVYLCNHNYAVYLYGEHARGKIIALDTHDGQKYPQVSFQDHAGNTQQFTNSAATTRLAEGDAVDVLFLKHAPAVAVVDDGRTRLLFPAIFLFGGTILSLAGFAALLQRRRQDIQQDNDAEQ